MSVESHLRPDERIISTFEPYYATSSRVILFLEKNDGDVIYELPYSRIEKIEAIRTSNQPRMLLGAVVTIASFIATFSLGMITPLLGVIVGVFLVLHGGIGGLSYYQIRGRGIPNKEMYRWQIRYRGAGSLIASIQTIIGDADRRG